MDKVEFGKTYQKLYDKSKYIVEVDSLVKINDNIEHDSFEK